MLIEPPTATANSIIPTFGFIDDQSFMVAKILRWQIEEGLPPHSTDDWEEALRWVRDGEIAFLLTDLRLDGRSGLDLLQTARGLNPVLPCAIVTAFEPSPGERRRASQLEVPIYKKGDALEDYLLSLKKDLAGVQARRLFELEARNQMLEQINSEWTQDLIECLLKVRSAETAVVNHGDETFTVAELIEDIRNFRPRGIEHIKMYRRLVADHLKRRGLK